VISLTVHSDLKKALAAAESAKGSYAVFAENTEDPMAKAMFGQMAQDMDSHIQLLNSRLNYLDKNNPLNARQEQQQQ
jgi:rubrerythrin